LAKAELGNLAKSDIVLMRFANNSWAELPTKLAAEKDDGSAEFAATTPGFSVFVATTRQVSSQTQSDTTLQPGGETDSSSDAGGTSAISGLATAGGSPALVYGLYVIIIAGCIVGFFFIRKKSRKR